MDERRAQLEAQLSAYLDNELTDQQRAEVEAFLAKDADARAMLAELKAVSSALRSLPRARASSDLMDNLRARMERKALLGEEETRPTKAGGGMSSTGRWVAAATIILMTGVTGYVTWIINGSDHHIASPHQQLTLSEQSRNDERKKDERGPEVGKPLEMAVNQSRGTKALVQRESAPKRERMEVNRPVPASGTSVELLAKSTPSAALSAESAAKSSMASSAQSRTESTAMMTAAAPVPSPSFGNNIAAGSASPSILVTSQPSPATVLMVACADDASRRQLLSEVRHTAGDERAADQVDAVDLCNVTQMAPHGGNVIDINVVVADERARDDMVRRLSRGVSSKRAVTMARQASVATNAPTNLAFYDSSKASTLATAPSEKQAAITTTDSAKMVRPNAAADSSMEMAAGGIGRQPAASPAATAYSRITADDEAAPESSETRPAASTAPSQHFVRLNIRIAEPTAGRPSAGVTASSPATSPASLPAASSPTTHPWR